MARNSRLVWGAILLSVFWVATAAPASARELWIVEEASEEVQVFQSATDSLVGDPIPVGSEPRSIAFSPDGTTAYVAERGDHSVTPIDVATKTPGTPFDLGSFVPDAVAVSPDGARVFVAGPEGLVALNPSTGAILGEPWILTHAAPPEPADLAVLPSGARAYTPMDRVDGSFAEFDLTAYGGTEVGTRTHFEGGSELRAAAVTPDGTQVLIGGENNGIVDTATGKLTSLVTLGSGTSDVAITPDGRNAYAVGDREALWRYSLPSGTFDGTAISPGDFDSAVALDPAGDLLFVVGESFPDHQLFVLDQASHARIGLPIALDGIPVSMATTPDQAPVASLEASAAGGEPGVSISFDASGSQDPDGTIERYDWNFGDGSVALDAGPTAVHTYPKAGSFQASVTLTDGENCSVKLVYTGRSAYCAGGPVARATEAIQVGKPEEPKPEEPAVPGGQGTGTGAVGSPGPIVTTPIAPAIPPNKKTAPKSPKCHKGFKKQKVHGKVRCVKAQKKRHRY